MRHFERKSYHAYCILNRVIQKAAFIHLDMSVLIDQLNTAQSFLVGAQSTTVEDSAGVLRALYETIPTISPYNDPNRFLIAYTVISTPIYTADVFNSKRLKNELSSSERDILRTYSDYIDAILKPGRSWLEF